ncbi:MATE family efflux transporter, partial [Rhodovulum sulfidophilum]|uniref:MATE family efflux transporter n=1 Tax=Rhodovulum sulfidophilum TaxID=35806 RepID=UPI00227960AA
APASPDRAAVLAVGTGLLAAAALFQLVDAAQVMALGLLRGVQDTRVPMVMAGISYWLVGMPVSYGLGFGLGWGGIGIWLGLALGLALAGVLMMARFWSRDWVPAAP